MSVIECLYKYENKCNKDSCKNCYKGISLYTGKDKRKLCLEMLSDMKRKMEDVKDIQDMRFISGHCSQHPSDYDSIYYMASGIRLVQLKYLKYIDKPDYCSIIDVMRLLGLRVSKWDKRRYMRYLKYMKKKNSSDLGLYHLFLRDWLESEGV